MTAPPPGPPGPQPHWPGQPPFGGYPHPPTYPGGYPPPGYPGYPGGQSPWTEGHQPWGTPWKPGVIPLRPLSMSDIFNGAVAYVRANPRATLGMTTAVVLVTAVLGFAVEYLAPLAAGDTGLLVGILTGAIATVLATILLSGMLTVVVARAVLGRSITVGQTWQRVRGRMPALITLTLLELLAVATLIGAVILTIAGVARAADGAAAALVGIPLVLLLIAALGVLFTVLSLAPMAIVLEHRSVTAALARSVALARPQFWRILGIRLLASLVATLVAAAIAVPFEFAGQLVSVGDGPAAPAVLQTTVTTIGAAIGQIITTPFTAGVAALLYVDARIRSEAFDFLLQSASQHRSDADNIWLPR